MSVRVTDCECTEAGWCERHQCHKSEFWYQRCQRYPSLFAAWEKGHGPGQVRQTGTTSYPSIRASCVSVREVLREEECPSCRGNVRIKVFRCELHGECTLSSKLSSVRACRACPDYVAERVTEE